MLSPKDLLQQLAKIFTKNYKVKTTRFVTSQVEHHRATLHVFAAFVSCCEYIPQHECFFVSYCDKQCRTVVWMLTSVSLLATNVFSSIPLRLHIFKEIALTDLSHVYGQFDVLYLKQFLKQFAVYLPEQKGIKLESCTFNSRLINYDKVR